MVDRLPSLELLLELVRAERTKQLTHFDALDNKAGVVLAFAGLLITLTPEVPAVFQVIGVVSASASMVLALTAFWPRRFPLLEPSPLRKYLRAEASFTRLTVLDNLEEFVNEGTRVLRAKAMRLTWALRLLVAGAVVFAMGIVARAF